MTLNGKNTRSIEAASIRVSMPSSLFRSFEAVTAIQGISIDEACRRLVLGLSGHFDADLGSLPDPPKELIKRNLKLGLDWRCVDKLAEASRISGLGTSSIFRRLLYAILITRTIRFISCKCENAVCMQINEIHTNFTDDFESDGPSPLLSRQHREQT